MAMQFLNRIWLMVGYCIISSLTFVTPNAHADVATEVLRDALVKVTCVIPGKGKLVSTGFVWPDNGFIVTALHGVAGCQQGKLSVKSEKTADVRLGHIENVSQEGDLALIRLLDRSGQANKPFPVTMKPLRLSTESPLPKVVNHYSISSYPGGGTRNDDFLAFRGSTPFVANLGTAFSPDDTIQDLLRSQTYPQHGTQVLRIGSLLRHGQSGAPIVDPSGRLVAIADGGLNGGFIGLNWAVVAERYLDRLKNVQEASPDRMSKTAEAHLVSALLPEDKKVVKVPNGTQGLEHVRRLPFTYLYETLSQRKEAGGNDSGLSGLENIIIWAGPEEYQSLSFDVYEDATTGATIGVPAQLDLTWDEDLRALIATDDSSLMIVVVRRYESYSKAVTRGKSEFLQMLPGVNWVDFETHQSIREMKLTKVDEAEWANQSRFYDGSVDGVERSLNLSVTVSGDTLLGYALIGTDDIESAPKPELVSYFMMETSVLGLADFAVY